MQNLLVLFFTGNDEQRFCFVSFTRVMFEVDVIGNHIQMRLSGWLKESHVICYCGYLAFADFPTVACHLTLNLEALGTGPSY